MSSEDKDEQSRDKFLQPTVIRRRLPIARVKASTLEVLKGTTADPGLNYYWAFPRRLSRTSRWLVIWVALSRMRRLKNLRSIGLNMDIRNITENGSPDWFPAQFHTLFNEKEEQTALDAEAAVVALGLPASH